nr:MAG TPA: hypothetical protein [Caudoviricetes sp.]
MMILTNLSKEPVSSRHTGSSPVVCTKNQVWWRFCHLI